jgi:hypothetical protein
VVSQVLCSSIYVAADSWCGIGNSTGIHKVLPFNFFMRSLRAHGQILAPMTLSE